MKNALAVLALVACIVSSSRTGAANAVPAPFRAEYVALRNGEDLGRTTLALADNHDGTWTLTSETRGTSGLAKLADVHIVETSHFRWHDGRPEAIEYNYRQDSAIKSRTRHAAFDRAKNAVDVEEGGKAYHYAIEPDLIDRQAVTLALAADLMRGAKAFDYKVAVMDHVEAMRYERAGSETLSVPAGTFETVLMRRIGEAGADRKRVARSWFSEKLGWMPVQIEQTEKKGDTVTLRLEKVLK